LLDSLRAVDKAFRFGGEEMAAILPSSDAEGARQAAERLRVAIAGRGINLPDGRSGSVTVSIGVAMSPKDGTDAEALLKAADAALYRSKAEGRNRVTMSGSHDGSVESSC
jgi:diguanylate cyclase (GGDEF)-like protein